MNNLVLLADALQTSTDHLLGRIPGGSTRMGQPLDQNDFGGIIDVRGLPLFPRHFSVSDFKQGLFANCYVQACGIGLATKQQDKLGRLMRETATGLVSGDFYAASYNTKGQVAATNKRTVEVDSLMPLAGNRTRACSYVNYLEKLWVAYRALCGGIYAWGTSERGYPGDVLNAWGFNVNYLGRGFPASTADRIAENPNEITVMTTNVDIMGGHCMSVLSVRYGMVFAQNPWGSDGIFNDNADDGTIAIPLTIAHEITNNVVMTNGVVYPIPSTPSPTERVVPNVKRPPAISPMVG